MQVEMSAGEPSVSRNRFSTVLAILLTSIVFALVMPICPQSAKIYAYSITYWIVAVYVLATIWNRISIDPLSPPIISYVLLFLYSIASAANAGLNGKTIYGDTFSIEVLDKYYIACMFGCTGLGIGFVLSKDRSFNRFFPHFLRRNTDNATFFNRVWPWITLVGISLVPYLRKGFDITNIQSYGDTAFLSRVLFMQQGADQGIKEYLTYQAPLSLVIVLGILLLFRGKTITKPIGLAILGLHFACLFLGGSRTGIAFLACMLLVFINYRVKKIRLSVVVAIACVGLLMINVVSVLRVTSDPSKMVEAATQLATSDNQQALNLANSGELLTGQNLLRLIKGIDNNETNYTYGSSIASEFLVFIPRGVLSNRPLTRAEDFVDTFYPGVLESGGGYGFFYIMEGYWAFGFAGVLMLMAGYGFLINGFYHWCMNNITSDAVAIIYGLCIYPLAMYSVRSGLILSIKTMFMYVVPLLIIMCLPNLISYFKNRPELQ